MLVESYTCQGNVNVPTLISRKGLGAWEGLNYCYDKNNSLCCKTVHRTNNFGLHPIPRYTKDKRQGGHVGGQNKR